MRGMIKPSNKDALSSWTKLTKLTCSFRVLRNLLLRSLGWSPGSGDWPTWELNCAECRMRQASKEEFCCFHIHKFVLADLTFRVEAALPTRRALTPGQTVGGSRLIQAWRYGPFGLGEGQGCGRVTQAVAAAPVFVHHSGLGLLINGARCREEAS